MGRNGRNGLEQNCRADKEKILNAYQSYDIELNKKHQQSPFGNGNTGEQILNIMLSKYNI